MTCCHDDACCAPPQTLNSPQWRRALWIALAVNAGFFLGEMAAGLAAGSAALQADALDFFGDAANYAISLGVAGLALAWRARAALVKGGTLKAMATIRFMALPNLHLVPPDGRMPPPCGLGGRCTRRRFLPPAPFD
jgi:Co/Zn/Cd efflux system component